MEATRIPWDNVRIRHTLPRTAPSAIRRLRGHHISGVTRAEGFGIAERKTTKCKRFDDQDRMWCRRSR